MLCPARRKAREARAFVIRGKVDHRTDSHPLGSHSHSAVAVGYDEGVYDDEYASGLDDLITQEDW